VTPDGQFSLIFDTPVMARGWRDATQIYVQLDGPSV
jgi:hypothetical protein